MSTPTPEAIRAAIEAQTCPFCGKGPYKVVAGHTKRVHDIDRRQLRDMAGLRLVDSICAPEHSAERRENALRSGTVAIATEAARHNRSPRTWTTAGLAKSRASRQAGSLKSAATKDAETSQIIDRFRQLGGTPEAVEQLASERGISRRAMRQRLVDHGCEVPTAWVLASQRRRRYSDADIHEMARLYKGGMSQSQIGERFATHQATVSHLLAAERAVALTPSEPIPTNGDT